MALQTTESALGVTFNSAYTNIVNISWSKGDGYANIQTVTYTDSTKTYEIESNNFSFTYDVNGGEALTQAYTYLKTLDEFSGAVDV